MTKNVIKNIYTTNEKYLEKVLEKLKQDCNITYSIVTNQYVEIYQKCGFKVNKNDYYKNFVEIYKDNNQ